MAFAYFWPLVAVVVLTFSLGAAFWRWDIGPVFNDRWRALSEFIGIALKPAAGVWIPPEPEYSEAPHEPQRARVRSYEARRAERLPLDLSFGRGLRLAA